MSLVFSYTSAKLLSQRIAYPSIAFGLSKAQRIYFHSTPTNHRKMVSKLDNTQRTSILRPILDNGWKMDANGRDAIKKKFVFGDFNEAFGFMTRVAIKG